MRLGFCAVCGSRESPHDHHWIARANGGSDDETNLLTLCPKHHGEMHGVIWDNKHSQLVKAGQARAIALYEDDSEIVAGYNSGKSIAQLSAEFGLSRTAVARVLRKGGVVIRSHYLGEAREREILARYALPGARTGKIAQEFGIARTTVQRVLRRAGVPLRGATGPRKNPKITDVQRREIVAIGLTKSASQIAAEYGISRGYAANIRLGVR